MIFSTLPSQQPFTYTWATKPPAAGNAGSRIRVQDLRNLEFESDGTYWRPPSGSLTWAVDMTGVQTQNTAIAAITAPNMPAFPIKDWLSTPGFSMRTELNVQRSAGANTQSATVHIRPSGLTVNLAFFSTSGTSKQIMVKGTMSYFSATNYESAQGTEVFSGVMTNGNPRNALSGLSSGMAQLVLSANTGDTGGTEVMDFCGLTFVMRF